MSTFVLKIIAMLTMLIDHLTVCFVPSGSVLYAVGRGIGRISFPIFCFLIVEGFYYTHSWLKYSLRLLAAAVVSEVAFDMAFHRSFCYPQAQNVIWTLLIGLLAVLLLDTVKKKFYPNSYGPYLLFSCLIIAAAALGAYFLKSDYGMYGILVILIMYYFRGRKIQLLIAFALLTFFFAANALIGSAELIAAGALIFIFLYNGKKGKDDHRLFYLFYPVHLAILGIIVMFVM